MILDIYIYICIFYKFCAILCNTFNIKYDTWYFFFFLFFLKSINKKNIKIHEITTDKMICTMDHIQWHGNWRKETRTFEHVNCTRKISEVSISTHLICSSRIHCIILKIPRRKPFHWDTWTIISILGFIRDKKFHIWIYLVSFKKKKEFYIFPDE